MKDILANMDVQTIRGKVFEMFGLPEPSPRNPSHRILQKAHYTFMIDKDFMQQIRETKQSHERFMTAILASDVFPGLDTANPLDSKNEDDIPQRFGPKWFEYEREERKQSQVIDSNGSHADDEEESRKERIFEKVDTREIDELDTHLDQQKRLLFTETRMKAINTV